MVVKFHLKMNKFETVLDELKAIVQNPRVYLVNYFDEIRNQIDVECQTFLNRPNLSIGVQDLAIQQQEELISQVDLFQTKCLTNLHTISYDQAELEDLENRFNIKDEEIDNDIYCALYNRKKLLFKNKGLMFFNLRDAKEFIESSYNELDSGILFGLLFLIDDEFLLDSDDFQLR